MLNGIALVLLALLLAAASAACVAGERRRETARLDRRLAPLSAHRAATLPPCVNSNRTTPRETVAK